MTETERMQALLLKIKNHFCDGNAALLARHLKKDGSYINRLFYPEGKKGAKGIGIEIMDACKKAFPLPRGYWDYMPDDFEFVMNPLATSKPDYIASIIASHQRSHDTTRRLIEASNRSSPPEWFDTEIFKGDSSAPIGARLAIAERPEQSTQSNVEPRPTVNGNVPLISWVRAGEFCESPDNFEPGDAEEFLPRPLQNMGKHVFALTVRGDSMDTADGYREGEIVYVDPDKSPVSGQDVVARVDNKLNLKRYKEDQEGPYLLQLNGNIIIRPTGEWSICGVVVFSGKRR